MKLTVKKLILLSLVEKTSSILTCSGKETAPVLKNFHFEARTPEGERQSLRTIATDQDLTVIAESNIVNIEEPGDTIIPGKMLYDIVRECEDVDIVVETSGDRAKITANKARWDVQLMTEKYPPIPAITNIKWTSVPAAGLVAALRKVRGAVGKDATRPELTLIKLGATGVMATDGTRLHFAEIPIPVEVELQASAADELVKIMRSQMDQDIRIAQTTTHILFGIGNDVFLTTRLSVAFQPVETIISSVKDNALELQLSRQELQDAVARVRITADTETNRIVMALANHKMTLETRDKNNNSCTEELAVHWPHKNTIVSLNWMNLKSAISEMEFPNLTIMFGEPRGKRPAPVCVREENFQAIMNQLMVVGNVVVQQ